MRVTRKQLGQFVLVAAGTVLTAIVAGFPFKTSLHAVASAEQPSTQSTKLVSKSSFEPRPVIGRELHSDLREPVFGITVELPEQWTWDKHFEPQHRTLVLRANNFGGNYLHGGIIPLGGAHISVTGTPVDSLPNVEKLITEHLDDDKKVKRDTVKLAGGCSAILVESESSYSPKLTYKRFAVFFPVEHEKGSVLYRFLMTYNAAEGDAVKSKPFETAFREVVKSTSFKIPPMNRCSD